MEKQLDHTAFPDGHVKHYFPTMEEAQQDCQTLAERAAYVAQKANEKGLIDILALPIVIGLIFSGTIYLILKFIL